MASFESNRATLSAMSLAMIATVLGGCFEGPSFFQQNGTTSGSYAVVTSHDNGVTSGSFSASNSATQVISAGADDEIAGSAVAFPPGALAIDTSVSLQHGANLATSGLAAALGVSSTISSAGPAVVLSSSIAIDATKPFDLKLKRTSSSKLALAGVYVIVVYKVFQAAENKMVNGIIPTDELRIDGSDVIISTKYFGSYQVAESDKKISKAIEKTTTSPILTKNDEKELPKINLVFGQPTYAGANRTVTVPIKLSKPQDLNKCAAFVHTSKDKPWIDAESTAKKAELADLASGKSDTFDYKVKTKEAITLMFRGECEDTNGRTITSNFTGSINVPVAETPPSDSSPVQFTGFAAIEQSPLTRRINSTGSFSVPGSCDSSTGMPVEIEARGGGVGGGRITVSCVNNAFAFTIGGPTCTTQICLGFSGRGYRLSANQGGQYFAETVLYMVDDPATMILVNSEATLYTVLNTAAAGYMYILSRDMDLSGYANWSPISAFPAASFEGDLKTIKNLTITAGTANNAGLFATLPFGSAVRNLRFYNAVINLASFSSNAGILAGSIQGTKVEGIDINYGSIVVAGTTANIGGLVGDASNFSVTASKIHDVRIDQLALIAQNGNFVGGVVGRMTSSNLDGASLNDVNIEGKSYLGGIAGKVLGGTAPSIARTYFNGDIRSYATAATPAKVGGIAGEAVGARIEIAATNVRIYANSITSEAYGGIVGSTDHQVWVVRADAAIQGGMYAGGLIGQSLAGADLNQGVALVALTSCDYHCGLIIGDQVAGSSMSSGIGLPGSYVKDSSVIDRTTLVGYAQGTIDSSSFIPSGMGSSTLECRLAGATGNNCTYGSALSEFFNPASTVYSGWDFSPGSLYWYMNQNGPYPVQVPMF